MLGWLKKIFLLADESPPSTYIKCNYDAKYLNEVAINLINDIEIKANLVIEMYCDNNEHPCAEFAKETLNITIPLLVKSYEQTCIAGEGDTIFKRIGRYPLVIANDTLRGLLDCLEDILQGDTITFPKPALTHSIQNIIQIEETLQKRRYAQYP